MDGKRCHPTRVQGYLKIRYSELVKGHSMLENISESQVVSMIIKSHYDNMPVEQRNKIKAALNVNKS